MAASGTTTIDFGTYPGSHSATVDVTGQTGFTASSQTEAWVMPVATATHSVDEHRLEEIKVDAVYQADGTIRIYGEHTGSGSRSTNGHNLYGTFTVGWVWA